MSELKDKLSRNAPCDHADINVTDVFAEALAAIKTLERERDELRDNNNMLRSTLRTDEQRLQQWETRAHETHADMMRVVRERDELRRLLRREKDEARRQVDRLLTAIGHVVSPAVKHNITSRYIELKEREGGDE